MGVEEIKRFTVAIIMLIIVLGLFFQLPNLYPYSIIKSYIYKLLSFASSLVIIGLVAILIVLIASKLYDYFLYERGWF